MERGWKTAGGFESGEAYVLTSFIRACSAAVWRVEMNWSGGYGSHTVRGHRRGLGLEEVLQMEKAVGGWLPDSRSVLARWPCGPEV